MRRFLDSGHLPATPKSWKYTEGGKEIRIEFTNREHFSTFYARVKSTHENNGWRVPSELEVQNYICGQMPSGWCVEDGTVGYAGAVRHTRPPQLKPCGSCGRR